MVSEGTAEYLEYSYRQRYVDSSEGVDDRIEALSSFYRGIDGSAQLAWAPYRHGVVYVRERVENTTEIPLLFERPTVTTEQALHNETQATEPPRSLSVRVEPSVVDRRGAQGELFARIALEQSLGRSRAVEAAAGWGNDTLLEVEHGDTGGFVWVTRWDTPGDATEFRRAVEDAVESVRIDGTLYDVSVERPAFETAVIVIGPPAFQQAIDVEATDGAVEIGATANATAEGSAQGR